MTVLVLGLALLAFAVAGLAVDGTRAFLLRRSLQSAADSAALAGAAELDSDGYYSSGGRRIRIDPGAARRQTLAMLSTRGIPASASVSIEPGSVGVRLEGFIETSFLGLIGIDRVPVAVEARAQPFAGAGP